MPAFTLGSPGSSSDTSESSANNDSSSASSKIYKQGTGVQKGTKIIKDFDGSNSPEDFEFPSIGIEDIDRAVFKLFNKVLSFNVSHKGVTQKVPVIFATGERFALTRRKNPIRDKNNSLILPVISIMREDIDFSPAQQGKNTAISFREQSSYVIKHRLSTRDRKYQNLVNKPGIKNQKNVASLNNILENTGLTGGFSSLPNTVASRRQNKNLSFSADAEINLKEDLGNNIFEIIEIPYPEFVAVNYNVTFWTQYMSQTNQMLEILMMNFTGQGEEIPISTDAGYELVVFFKSPVSNGSNLDEFTDSERIIKHSFGITVPGYILNPKHPGLPKLARSYISAPTINFGFSSSGGEVVNYQPERHKEKVKRHVLTDITSETENLLRRGEDRTVIENLIQNPFGDNSKIEFSRVKLKNELSGETVASSKIISEIESQQE